ncbi:unnamed protein product [Ceutorhynchus assimilis]|uniref:ATP-dependent DNA helicase n=1 Tax=Ceutorhynchus assimilis TaxID=467358 RepID=A0A9N9QMA1_9CUCU|nr:unnamed protein product [Ceutorhynchus assimilis]
MDESDFTEQLNNYDRQIQNLEEQKLKILNKLKTLKQAKEELRLQYSLSKIKNRPGISEWLGKDYVWSKEVYKILKSNFKFDEFRSNQLAAINATLSKQDVLLIMPTGGGKSLVYQLPAIVTGNVSVVISPLLSLIEDQLMALRKFGIAAATVNSNSATSEKKEITAKMLENKLNLIFVTPEWMAKTKSFMNTLTKIYNAKRLERFIIDEVHCCSQWGHDFRRDYLALSILKGQFPGVPILGLTATATTNVMVEIQKILEIPDAVIITAPYNRPNLFYKVINKLENKSDSLDYLEKVLKNKYKFQSGIIYAATQKDCEELATELRKRDLQVAPYHANLEGPVKSKIHKKWADNTYQAVIATIAFGMGIDKPDVKFVIHYTVPKSLEGLYQESGRAGRDGKNADCTLMFNLTDWLRNFSMTQNTREEKSVNDILHYCINTATCRRKMISKYFDDDWRSSDCMQMCDHCKNPNDNIQTYNVISCLKDIINLIGLASNKEVNLTLKKLLDNWFKLGPKNLQLSGTQPKFTRQQGEHIVGFLLCKRYLSVRRGYSLVTTLAYIDTNPSVDIKSFNGKILMEYSSNIRGLPIENIDKIDLIEESVSGKRLSESHSNSHSKKIKKDV